jgi:hypothetical protein
MTESIREAAALDKGQTEDERVRRLRRRIEDVLRKSDAKKILDTARFLGIKIEGRGEQS